MIWAFEKIAVKISDAQLAYCLSCFLSVFFEMFTPQCHDCVIYDINGLYLFGKIIPFNWTSSIKTLRLVRLHDESLQPNISNRISVFVILNAPYSSYKCKLVYGFGRLHHRHLQRSKLLPHPMFCQRFNHTLIL